MKKLREGQRVTVLSGEDELIRCRVHIAKSGAYVAAHADGPQPSYECFLIPDREGVIWCRGWRGKAVDALQAAHAMAGPPPQKNGMLHGFLSAYGQLPSLVQEALLGAAVDITLGVVGGLRGKKRW